MSNVLADTDAFNINNKLGTSLLADVFRTYYISGTNTRYKDFAQVLMYSSGNKEVMRNTAGIYTDDWFLKPNILKWPLLKNVDVSDNQSIAVRDAFTDFIWFLSNFYLEITTTVMCKVKDLLQQPFIKLTAI